MANDYGNLVEGCRKIRLSDLLRAYRSDVKQILLQSKLDAMGVQIELTTTKINNGGTRFWMKCPLCNRKASVLYVHPLSQLLGCRNCLNLEYRSHRYKGMIENNLMQGEDNG
jgi:hypothetical protein